MVWVKVKGQRSGSRSLVKVKGQQKVSGVYRAILGSRLCRVQQRATTPYNQPKAFACVSLISGHVRVIERMQAIGF